MRITEEKKQKILIVDDEQLNLDLLEAVLMPERFSLETAMSGEEALEKIKQAPPSGFDPTGYYDDGDGRL